VAAHLRAGADPELAICHAQVVLDRAGRHVQRGGGLAVGRAAGDQCADIPLAGGSSTSRWSADPSTSASIDCPPDDSDPPHDPPPIPGMVGPSLLGATPATFELPADGGVQAIAGGIDGGDGDGFFPSGTLLVSRNK
jgi:hypothetical protein